MQFEEEFVDDWLDNDFNDFLNNQMDKNAVSGIQSDDDANYYIARVKRNRNMEKMFADKAKSILADYKCKVEMWRDKKVAFLTNDTDRCLVLLQDYYNKVAKNPNTKIRLPEGNIGFYKTRQSLEFDKEEVLSYLQKLHAEANMPIKDFIEITTSLNSKEFRAQGKVDEETGAFVLDGFTIPGVNVKPSKNEFNVR